MLPFAAVVLALALADGAARAADDFAYQRSYTSVPRQVVLDTRPLDVCRQQTLVGARCLPPSEFLGPGRRLPNERDLLWLLGTARLTGAEDVLVVGQDATARDFVAGLLYWAGQRQVRVLTDPMARVLKHTKVTAPGQERDFARAVVFEAPMRDEVVVLKHELVHELAALRPRLLDGRSAPEYWGETVRSARGGHIPGALSLPAAELLPAADGGKDAVADYLARGNWVAYAHDAYEGLAYLTRLRAGQGTAVRLYLGGWAEWAADGMLPADAVAYPDASAVRPVDAKLTPARAVSVPVPAILAMVLAAFAAGWWIQRRRIT